MAALRGDGLGPPSAPCGRVTGQSAGAVVAEIGLLRTATRIGIVDSHRRAFTLIDFVATVVTDEHRLASHDSSSFFDRGSDEPSRDPTSILRSFTSPAYSPRTQQADKRLPSGIRPVSGAPTTRKWRGRKSSIVP